MHQIISFGKDTFLLFNSSRHLVGILSEQDLLNRQDLFEQIRQRIDEDARIRQSWATLSDREHEVMDLLVLGKNTKEIARELGVSPKTVEYHRKNILTKMQVESVVELVRLILKTRL